jgi:hypothetical protein
MIGWVGVVPVLVANNNLIYNTMENSKIIEGVEIFDISLIAGARPYKNTKEGSKNHGKNYLTFSFEGKAFTANEDDEFVKLYNNDTLYRAKLGLVEREDKKGQYSWQVESAASAAKVERMVETTSKIEAIKSRGFKPTVKVESMDEVPS